MKRILFIIILAVCIQGYAQDELNSKTKPISGGSLKIKEATPPKEEAKPEPPIVVEKPDPLKLAEAELLKSPNQYNKKPHPDEADYRRNQYLGGVKTQSHTSTVRYRDAAAIDGDKIKVYVNDKLVEPEVVMDKEYKGFKIDLNEGINKIDFVAINEGFASPNTAEFQVYNDKGVVIKSSQWNVGTGYKATVLLLKE
ncbi:hypothetical protein [Flavobacterium sp.]|uniref:hypothetical protein n=1 Tax=Flavobacterium sp. TaxID=239 RepID=UPI0039E29F64